MRGLIDKIQGEAWVCNSITSYLGGYKGHTHPHPSPPSQEPLHALGVVEKAVDRPEGQQLQRGRHVLLRYQTTQLLHHTKFLEGFKWSPVNQNTRGGGGGGQNFRMLGGSDRFPNTRGGGQNSQILGGGSKLSPI